MSRAGWRKLLTVSVPAVLVSILVAQCVVELWVRARWDPRRGRPGFFLSDPVRGQRLAAGYDGWFAGVPVHINSLELRDPREYDLAKGPDTFRILVLGDSVTFGHGSVYEHTYPYLTEQRLKAWRPDVDWQVWNAAVPGYNTSQELAHLLEVGDRFKPDLVVVGFFENDLVDNSPPLHPGVVRRGVSKMSSFARRHLYSLELYKKAVLTLAWRLSNSNEYKKRLDHLGSEEALLESADMSTREEQRLTPYDRLTEEDVSARRCVYGMKPNPDTIPDMQRQPDYPRWVAAVRGFQDLHRQGRFRVAFFVNDGPDICGNQPESDFFYDGGTRAIDRMYLSVLGEGTPAISTYETFMHRRPSQMPAVRAHALGNANDVKADVLFGLLREQLLPPLLDAARR